MDEADTILSATLTLKRNIIVSLTKVIEELTRDKAEREEWLLAPNAIMPTFTRKLGKPVITAIAAVEEREYKKGRSKILTRATKQHLKTLEMEQRLAVEELTSRLRQRYDYDLANDPDYIGLSPEELAEVQEEFDTRLAKDVKRVENDYARRRQDTIDRQPISRKRQKRQTSRVVPGLAELREEYKLRHENLLIELDLEEEDALDSFEEQLPEYRQQGYTPAEIETTREDFKDQLLKTRNRRIAALVGESNRLGRQLLANILAKEHTADVDRSAELSGLLATYAEEVKNIQLFKFGSNTWEDFLTLVDNNFEKIRDWSSFVRYVVAAWSNMADETTRAELDRLVRMYAHLYLDDHNSGDEEFLLSAEDAKIAKLSEERTTLLSQVTDLDTHIAVTVKKLKDEIAARKRHGLKRDTAPSKPSTARQVVTPVTVQADHEARRRAWEAALAEEEVILNKTVDIQQQKTIREYEEVAKGYALFREKHK